MMPCKWKITLGREGQLMGLVGCLESDNHNTFKMEPSVSTILIEEKRKEKNLSPINHVDSILENQKVFNE